MSSKDAVEALEQLAERCAEIAKEKTHLEDTSTVRTILAAVRCAQEHLANVESAAILPRRWDEIVSSIKESLTYIRRMETTHFYPVETTIPDEFLLKIQALPLRKPKAHQQITQDFLFQTRHEAEFLFKEFAQMQRRQEEKMHDLHHHVQVATEALETRTRTLDQLKKEAEAAETRRAKRFDQQLSRYEESFGAFEVHARERLDSESQKIQDTYEQSTQEYETEFRRIWQGASDQTETVLDELKQHLVRAEEIVGVVSKTALAGSYSEVAQRERKDANTWRWISVAAMSGIIACAIFALVHSLTSGFSTSAFTAKIVTSFAFMILAAYAGKESARHRRSEQHARRMQLELATIDSYLLTLPEEQRHAIKAAVADRIFGQPIEANKPVGDTETSAPPLLEYLRLALGAAEKT
jgi:hypothetical protein